jgi:3-dehydroquinate dehydratase II
MKTFYILHGANLNLLGKREPDIYGAVSFEDFLQVLQAQFADIAQIHYFQSNHEGALIDKLQEVGFQADGIVLNAGGYSHTSVALRDAISAIITPVVEVHISNIYAREEFRHTSLLSAVCKGTLTGLGLHGYTFALQYLHLHHKLLTA